MTDRPSPHALEPSFACPVCLKPLTLTAQQKARGVRFHAGSCAAASRGMLWPEQKIRRHMQKMRAAARVARMRRFYERLNVIAPAVSKYEAARLYNAGYQAGWAAKHRASA